MKLLIAASLFAAALSAATINFDQTSTVLAGGEVITIGATSATFTAIPSTLVLQITGDTSTSGSPLTSWSIDVPWDVDGETSLLHVTGTFSPGSNWNINSVTWPKTALAATNAEFGYPVLIKQGGMLGNVFASGALGNSNSGAMFVQLGLATPEPGTFILLLPLMALAARSLQVRRRSARQSM